MTSELEKLRKTVSVQADQLKQVVELINGWANYSIKTDNILMEQADKISYLEKTLNSILVSRNCITCFGFGLHTDRKPMEQMDAIKGMRTVPCPECGANLNGK